MAGLIKVVKNRSYFKRFQVKFRRRREGKTDFYARRRLITQDKNKYDAKKHRLIVRKTNQRIICQVAYATIAGDVIVCQADSSELKKYGIKVGLTNYPAAYCTGLLCARRCLKKFDLDSKFKVNDEVGEDKEPEFTEANTDERAPFLAALDIGLARSSVGAKIFGAMKGAIDGGMNIPHDNKCFFGYDKEKKEYNPEAHRDNIMGKNVANYMKMLKEENAELFEKHFSQFIKHGITAENIEEMYKKAHVTIRENPLLGVKEKKKVEKAVKKISIRAEKRTRRLKAYEKKKKLMTQKKEFLAEITA